MPDQDDTVNLDKDSLEPRATLAKRKKRSHVDMDVLHDLDTGDVRTRKRIKKAATEPRLPKRKKRSRVNADELHDLDTGDARTRKRIEMAATEPWYLLYRLGSQKLRVENRNRLRFLLQRLVQQQNWVEASGVLSVYLKATCHDRSPENNRLKYSVLMEVLARVEGDKFKFTRMDQIYQTWMRKISRKNCLTQDKLPVHLKYMLFCLTQGEMDHACNASTSIEQEKQLETDPMANAVAGLFFYHKWFSTIPNVMRQKDVEPLNSPPPSNLLDERFRCLDADAKRHTALSSLEANSRVKYESDSSVMLEKRVPGYSPGERLREGLVKTEDLTEAVKTEYLTEASSQHNVQSRGFYLNSSENEVSLSNDAKRAHCASILPELGVLDPILFPILLPQNLEDIEDLIMLHQRILNDHYKNAVKHLQLAVNASPRESEALLPLLQLLLVGGRVSEAFNMLEDVCRKSVTAFPLRLRAVLVEKLDPRNYPSLSANYELILKRDPTDLDAISGLVRMHQLGEYNVESLVEMVALHLDATNGGHNTWREFASCFLKLARQEEDCLSRCVKQEESDTQQSYSNRAAAIPKMFTAGHSGKAWRFRCRWWRRRHFSCGILESDIAAGDLELLTSKAACAAHMFGQGSEYVTRTSNVVGQKDNREMSLFLQLHKRKSLDLDLYFQQNTTAR